MNTWFKTKISYLKQAENGSIFKKKEEYVINALSFTEAEARLQGILEEYIPEYNLEACTKSNVNDIIINEAYDNYFQIKVVYVSVDADSGKEKKITEVYLIQSDQIETAMQKVKDRMTGSIVDWELTEIKKTNIIDVFPYVDELVK